MKTPGRPLAERIAQLDWPAVERNLDAYGCSTLRALLTAAETIELAACYEDGDLFRSTVVMAQHGFGRGEYKYFTYPLPQSVATLRAELYGRLAPIANRWCRALGGEARYPADHAAYLARCRRGGTSPAENSY